MLSYRWRCFYGPEGAAPPRDVVAQTEDGARRIALWAERLVAGR